MMVRAHRFQRPRSSITTVSLNCSNLNSMMPKDSVILCMIRKDDTVSFDELKENKFAKKFLYSVHYKVSS